MSSVESSGDDTSDSDPALRGPRALGGTAIGYFQGASSSTFNNPSIIHVHGDYYTPETQRSGLTSLERHISNGAMFDSAARYPAGECHPGTRTEVIDEIRAWAEDPNSEHDIFWLHGSAGVGKTALMQTIAQLLHREHKGLYAASYFFANGILGHQEASSLFPTLAYQVAINLPAMRPLMEEALDCDFTLPTKAMPSQVQSLLVEPFKLSPIDYSKHTATIIIDGLDECMGSSHQMQILTCIADALSSGLPLRFLIASRPEHRIKNAFSRDPLLSRTKSFSLNDKYLSAGAKTDIQKFLQDGFANIYAIYSSVLCNVERPWPSSDTIDYLVNEASGQFIYAATILKFVDHPSDFCDPQHQLDILMDTSKAPSRASPFEDVDKLYIRILSVYPRHDTLKKVLGGLLLNFERPVHFEALLGVELREVYTIFNFLSSVLHISEENKPSSNIEDDMLAILPPPETRKCASFCHKSMRDFLMDEERSGEFSINVEDLAKEILSTFIYTIISALRGGSPANEHYHNTEVYSAIRRLMGEQYAAVVFVEKSIKTLHRQLRCFGSATCQCPAVLRPDILLCSLYSIEQISDKGYEEGVGNEDELSIPLRDILRDKCYPVIIELMIDMGYLTIEESLAHLIDRTIHFYYGGHSLSDASKLPVISPDCLRSFILKTPDPLTTVTLRGEPQSVHFNLLPPIKNFFKKQIRGKYLLQYRDTYLHLCYCGLSYITNEVSPGACDSNTMRYIIHSLMVFFDEFLLDRAGGDRSVENMPEFIALVDMLLGLKWTEHTTCILPSSITLSYILMVWADLQFQRSRRNVNGFLSQFYAELLPKLQDLPTRLFETVILPAVKIPMRRGFSEIMDIPFNSDGEVDPLYSAEVKPPSAPFDFKFSRTDIFHIASYLPGDLGARMITHVTEIYFNIWAYNLYHIRSIPIKPQDAYLGTEFVAVYFGHVLPTKQILHSIRVMRHLYNGERRASFLFPNGFSGWIAFILKKYNQSVVSPNERQQFAVWIKCLKEEDKPLLINKLVGYYQPAMKGDDFEEDQAYHDAENGEL